MTAVQGILYIATLYNLALAVLILWTTRTQRAGGSFAWYILCTAAWTACVATIQFTSLHAITIWLVRSTFFLGECVACCGLWFCAEFPLPSARFRQLARYLTVLGIPWLVLAWSGDMIPAVDFRPWGVEAKVGMLVLPFTIWIGICILASIVHLITKARQLRGLARQQVRYILLGIIGLAVTALIPNLLLPALTGSTRYAPLGALASLFVTTTTTYAIMRYRLLDIRIVLRAGLIYSLTIALLSLLFATLVPLLERLLSTSLSLPSNTGSFLIAFLIMVAFTPLRDAVQRLVDQRFFKSVYDFRKILRDAGDALAAVSDRDVLVATVRDALVEALKPRGVAIYLPDHAGTMAPVAWTDGWTTLPPLLSAADPVLEYAAVADDVLVADELCRQPHRAAIGTGMQAWGAAIAIPLLAGTRLCGVVFLGEKLSGDVYTSNDLGLLRILGKQAAIALDNARHFDEVVLMNEYHTRLLNTLQDGVLAVDPHGLVITANHAAARITGVPVAETLGQRLEMLGLAALALDEADEQGRELTLATRREQEMPVPVLATVTPFRRRWETEDCHLIVLHDLSALRALEREKLQAERFSSMGAMAASLAYEIKNPLAPIQAFAQSLADRYDDAEFRKEFSQTVGNEVEKINRLVSQMLDLVRQPSSERGIVDMREVIEHLLLLTMPDCEQQRIQVSMTCAADLPMVVGMVGQLYQAILNILLRAIQVMPAGGVLAIDLWEADETLICRISDSGPGLPVETLPELFDPLATADADASGFGLALTQQFIHAHGGDIFAESPDGAGVVITVQLPVWRRTEAELVCC